MRCRLPCKVGSTLLIASGSHTKFLSRLDIEMRGRPHGKDFSYGLIPVLADAITPDPEMAGLIAEIRGPHEAMLVTELARTETLLYRRGNSTARSTTSSARRCWRSATPRSRSRPGSAGATLILPGQPITWDDVYNATAISYPNVYRTPMKGEKLKTDPRGCRRQPVQPRSLLPAGRRHGARRRHGLSRSTSTSPWASASPT